MAGTPRSRMLRSPHRVDLPSVVSVLAPRLGVAVALQATSGLASSRGTRQAGGAATCRPRARAPGLRCHAALVLTGNGGWLGLEDRAPQRP